MIDTIGLILGAALAIIFGIWGQAPASWPKIPTWAAFLGIGFGIFLLGLTGGLIIGTQRKPDNEPQLIETDLFLQFSDMSTTPVEKNPRNIQSWSLFLRRV